MKLTLPQIRKTVIALVLVLIGAASGYWWGTHQVQLQKTNFVPRVKINNKGVPETKDLDFNLLRCYFHFLGCDRNQVLAKAKKGWIK